MLSCTLEGNQLILEGELRVAFVDSLWECLKKAQPQNQELEVDLAKVAAVDVAGLQMLLAFLRSRKSSGATRLKAAPPTLLRALELTGLWEHFAPYLD